MHTLYPEPGAAEVDKGIVPMASTISLNSIIVIVIVSLADYAPTKHYPSCSWKGRFK